jgi:hypothetical protein
MEIVEFNPFESESDTTMKENFELDENNLVNELRNLWRNRENRDEVCISPEEQYEKEQQEKLYRRELRYVTQMYTVFKVGSMYYQNKLNDNFEMETNLNGDEEEYFEYAEPNWNNLKEYSKSKDSGRKRGRPKKEIQSNEYNFIEEPYTEKELNQRKGIKGRPKGSGNKKSTRIVKLLKWDNKAEKIKTTRQYYKFLRKDFKLKKFKNNEYKIPKKQWKLLQLILAQHLIHKTKPTKKSNWNKF